MPSRHRPGNPGNFSRTHQIRQPSHFDNPEYAFRSIILGYSLDEFTKGNWKDQKLSPLENCYDTVDEYFNAFIPHIFVEARAIIQQGLQELTTKYIYTASRVKIAKNSENPSTIYFAGDFPDDVDCGHSCVAVTITIKQVSYEKEYLGLAFSARPGQNRGMHVKLIVDDGFPDWENGGGVEFNIGFLGSLLQAERMYTVCVKQPDNDCIQEIIRGELSPWPCRRNIYDLSNQVGRIHLADDQKECSGLNDRQRVVCEDFSSVDSGVYLLQGPPGTGKTTTIAHLVSRCVADGKLRILVSAPSNKAIHVLAERILPMLPEDLPVAMAGVSEKVPDELRGIFVHDWSAYMVNRLEKIKAWVVTGHSHQAPVNVSQFIATVTELLAVIKRQLPYHKQVCDSLLKSAKDYIASVKIQNPNQVNHRPRVTRRAYRQYPSMSDEISSNEQETLLKGRIQQLQSAITKISEIEMLSQANIIFATASVAARSSMRQIEPCDIIIYDEAGQSGEIETMLLFLFGSEHAKQLDVLKLLLVGDPKQLPATTVAKYSDRTFYSRSMMERLQVTCHQPTQMLTIQYRMEPWIRWLPSYFFYKDKLEDGPNIQSRNNPLRDLSRLFQPLSFIDVSGNNNERQLGRSRINMPEAEAIVRLLAALNRHYPKVSIGVISFYRAQIEYLRNQIDRRKINNTIIQTVDGFQGGERDMIIISSVRSNPHGSVGFLCSERRLNVAITRARFSLITFGSYSTIMASNSDYFIHQWLVNLKAQKLTFTLKNMQQQLDVLQQRGVEQAASHFHTSDKNPWANIRDRYRKDQIVPVRIDRFLKNGIQVTLELGVNGFIPHYEIKQSLQQIQAKFKQGATLKVSVVKIDEQKKSIRLSLKRVAHKKTPPADRSTAEIGQLQLNEQYEGTVIRVTRHYYHVRIVGNRAGVLPNLQNRNVKHKTQDTVNHIKAGDKVIVELVGVDKTKNRINFKLVQFPVATETPSATAAATVGMFGSNSGRGGRRRQLHASEEASAIPSDDYRYQRLIYNYLPKS